MPQTALIISATAPVPVDNGKRVVLYGLLEYFVARLGAENVHYALLGDRGTERPDFPGVAHRLDRPAAMSQLATIARRLPRDRSYTVQEAMLGARSVRDQIAALVAWLRPTVEVYDTLRIGQHAPDSPRARRRVLYLDDLFSVRYQRMLDIGQNGDVDINPLGEFAANVPGPLRALIRRPEVYWPVLRMERDRIARREAEIVHSFDASLLVNSDEVQRLRTLSGSAKVEVIHGMLPPITPQERRPADPPELVFLGRLNIPHNDDAICAFLRAAMGPLAERHPRIRLRIIGKDPSEALRSLVAAHAPRVTLEGFVEDLDEVFASATASLAPLRFGSGVKIKMLEALARGVPTLATSVSVEGIPIAHDGTNGCLVDDDLTRWPDLVDDLVDQSRNVQLSKSAAEFYEQVYGRDVVMAQYDRIFGLG